ncbi:MAG: hypothetical protein R3288_06040 [Woeseiaceae bacterium]|nr:hypothetical protein [Woeseiaceae bacterium]
MMQATHYQHSGKMPLGGLLLTMIGGAAAALLLAVIYGFLIFWSPFVYINFFITLGFGVGLGMAVGGLAKLGKLRNPGGVAVVALLISGAAYYGHWVVWLNRATDAVIAEPALVWQSLTLINAMGPWSIFGWTPSGWSLWAIWGIEALMIVGIGALGARGVVETPFCEKTGQWLERVAMPARFQPLDAARPIDSPQTLLGSLRPMTEPAAAYTEVAVATADGSDLCCVTLSSVEVEVKDGKEEAKKHELVRDMLFGRHEFDELTKLAGALPA